MTFFKEFPDELKDIIIHIHNICVAKTGVTESNTRIWNILTFYKCVYLKTNTIVTFSGEISDCEHGKFSDRNELKCYMFCLMEEASFVSVKMFCSF